MIIREMDEILKKAIIKNNFQASPKISHLPNKNISQAKHSARWLARALEHAPLVTYSYTEHKETVGV